MPVKKEKESNILMHFCVFWGANAVLHRAHNSEWRDFWFSTYIQFLY